MRSFSAWMILERQQDAGMREAAIQAFERCRKNTLVAIGKSIENTAKFIVRNNKKMPSDENEAYEFRKMVMSELMHGLGETSNRNIVGHFGLSAPASSKQGNWSSGSRYGSIKYNDMDGKNLFLPPGLTKADFTKRFNRGASVAKYTIDFSSVHSSFGGTFAGNRDSVSNFPPTITIYNFNSLDPSKDMNLDAIINDAMKSYAKGSGTKGITRALNTWYDMIFKEIERARFVFVHEYIHMLDEIRYKSKDTHPGNIGPGVRSAWDPADIEKTAYYMSDAEFNAYFQGAAAQVEDAVKSFLIASTNEMTASFAARKIPNFDAKTNKSKCAAVADEVVMDLYRVMNDNLSQETWVQDSMKAANVGSHGPLFIICFASIFWYSRNTSRLFLKDEKKRKKLLNRVYSLMSDVKKEISDYRERMSAGNIPTVQEFKKAREKFKPSMSVKNMGAQNAYALFYSGRMIGKKPFNPNLPTEAR
jgi:hypothetical protein